MSEPEDYTARVRVFCNDQTRNFHKKHGKTWLADFRKIDRTAEISQANAEYQDLLDYIGHRVADDPEADEWRLFDQEGDPRSMYAWYFGAPGWISPACAHGWTNWAHNRTKLSWPDLSLGGDTRYKQRKSAHEWIPGGYDVGAEIDHDREHDSQRLVNPRAAVACDCGRRETTSLPLGALALALDQIAAAGIDAVPIDVLVKATALMESGTP